MLNCYQINTSSLYLSVIFSYCVFWYATTANEACFSLRFGCCFCLVVCFCWCGLTFILLLWMEWNWPTCLFARLASIFLCWKRTEELWERAVRCFELVCSHTVELLPCPHITPEPWLFSADSPLQSGSKLVS